MTTTHEEKVEFESWVQETLTRVSPLSRSAAAAVGDASGTDEIRAGLAENGLLGALVPEEFGGLALSPLMIAALLRASGQHLVPTGLLSGSVVAPFVLGLAADEGDLLTAIAEGGTRIAWADLDGDDEVAVIDGHLTGTKTHVLDADAADRFLVTVGGTGVYLVDAAASGVAVETGRVLDSTRPVRRIHFTRAAARALTIADVRETIAQARLLLTFGLAAEAAGQAQATLDLSVSYALVREQFGRPIGSFQAVKHRCADMFVSAQGARAGTELVATTWESTGSLPAFETDATATYALRAALENATAAMQIHGGIAFTWEHDAHWYLKRAKAAQLSAPGIDETVLAETALDPQFDLVGQLFRS